MGRAEDLLKKKQSELVGGSRTEKLFQRKGMTPQPVNTRKEIHNNEQRKADGANLSAASVSPMVLPTASQPAVLPRFLPVTDTSAQATYAIEQLRGTKLSPKEEAQRVEKSVGNIEAQIERAQKEADEAWRKVDAYSRMNIPQEQITVAAAEYNVANQKLRDLTARRDALANNHYALKNEAEMQNLSGNDAFRRAMDVQKELNQWMRIYTKQEPDMSLQEQGAYMQGLREKYGMATDGDVLRYLQSRQKQLGDQLKTQGVDYDRISQYLGRQEQAALAANRAAKTKAVAQENPVLASLYSVAAAPAQGIDFLTMLGTGKGSVRDLENYVPYDPSTMRISGEVSAIREGVGEKIAGSVENENWGKVLQFLYNTGMSIGDSALQVAAFGPGATYLMGMSAAANQSRDILERGGTNGQAFWGGLAAGAAEAIFEKFSIDRLLSTEAGEQAWKTLLKQAGVEASEEMATEVANILSDAAIMGQRSSFNESVRAYRQQGMTEEQAKQQVFLDAIGQVALAGLGGALSGGVMGGGVGSMNLLGNRAQNTDVEVKRAEEIAKRFGAELRIGSIENGSAGEYQNGVITIDPTKGNPVRRVLIHELTHHMETSGLYGEFAQMMLDYAGNTMQLDVADLQQRIMQEYAQGGIVLDDAGAQRELVAKIAEGRLFQDEAAIRQLAQTNRNLFQRIYQWIRETAIKLRGTQEQQFLLDAQKLYEKALQGAGMMQTASAAQNLYAGTGARNANLDALARAQEMEAAGTDAESIRRETGWHRGTEGKWRWEIDDSGIRLKMTENIPNYLTVGELVDAPQIFEQYPEFAEMSVTFQSLPDGAKGQYNRNFDDIDLDYSLKNDPERLLDTLAHELQHATQNREGLAHGASPEYWQRKIEKGMDARTETVRREEARLRQELENIREQEPEFYADMMALYEIAPTVPRGAIDWDTLEKIEEDPIEWQTYDAQRDALEAKYGDIKVWDFNDLLYNIQRLQTNEGRTARELYRDTAGEIEAYDTQLRRTMSAEERTNTAPDLGGENVVFAEGGGANLSISEIKGQNGSYGAGVLLDTNIFDDVRPRDWGRVLREYVYKKMAGTELIMYDETGNPEAVYFARENDRVRKDGAKNSHKVIDKLARYKGDNIRALATVHLPEALATSGNETYTDEHSHQWMDEKGWIYRTAYLQDRNGNIYEATLNIADGRDRRILYDITNIRKIDTKKEATGGVVPSTKTGRGSHTSGNFESSITDNTEEVNSENSYGRSFDELVAAQKGTAEAVPKAQAMIEAGEPVYRIVEETGLHQGPDGTLRDKFGNVVRETGESVTEMGESVIEPAETVIETEQNARSGVREGMPKKATQAIERSENWLTERLGGVLSVPKGAQREHLRPVAKQLADEYLERGEVSDDAMRRMFDEAYDRGIVVDEEFYNENREIKEQITGQTLTLSAQDAADLQGYESLDQFRKAYFGSVRIGKDGMPVDSFYEELSTSRPDLFPKEITHPAERLQRIAEVSKSIRKVERHLDEHYGPNAEEFKDWAYRDFQAAVGDAMAEVRLAKRYADDRVGRKASGEPMQIGEVRQTYRAMKDARREYERESAKALLTEADQKIVDRMVRGELDPEKYSGANAAAIRKVYEKKAAYEQYARRLREYNAARRAKLREDADKHLTEANSWKDKGSGMAYSRETMERNVRDIAPKAEAERLIRDYFAPVHTNEATATQFKNEMRDMVRGMQLSRKVAKGNEISEAHAVQLIGEARSAIDYLLNNPRVQQREGKTLQDWQGVLDDVAANNPNLDMQKVDVAIERFRSIYDALFEQMNEARIRNGYEPVDYRKGYFPHFQKDQPEGLLSAFGKALGIQTEVTDLPTSINGITHTFKPGIQWFGASKQRTGYDTEYDAVQGFDQYIEGVANIIYHTDDIQRLRALATQMRYRTTDEGMREQIDTIENDPTLTAEDKELRLEKLAENGRYAMSNFVVELDEYTNLLAGKKSRHDRSAETQIGRKLYNITKALESRVAANMVAVNPGSWLTNFIPLTQAWAQVSGGDLMQGMWDTLNAYKNDDGFAGRSVFLTNRRGSDPLVQTWSQKASAAMSMPMSYIDQFTADSIVRARYAQNVKRGMSETEAMNEADSFAASVMADRSKGSMPTMFERRNPVAKLFTQFQLEVNNQLSYLFKDLPREQREKGAGALVAALLKFAIGAFIYDEIYEFIVGRRPALDPIGILNDTVGDWTGYELPNFVEAGIGLLKGEGVDLKTEKKGAYDAAVGLAENVAENTPFIGGLIGGGRVPISSALPNAENLGKAALNTEWSTEKRLAAAGKELAAPLTYLALPFGGGQIKKAYQTIDAMAKGGSYSVNAQGDELLQYPVYSDTVGDAAKSLTQGVLFGKTSLPTGREWIESEFKSLGAKETAVYKALTGDLGVRDRDAYALLQKLRGAQKTDEVGAKAQKRTLLHNSELSGEAKATVYYGLLASDKEKAAMDVQADLGADAGATYELLMELQGLNKSADKMDAVFASGLDDQQKLMMYYDMVASEQKREAVDLLLESGADAAQVVGIVQQHKAIDASGDPAAVKATEFAYWIDGQDFKPEQQELINNEFGFSSGFRAGADQYNELKERGMKPANAMAVYEAVRGLTPAAGKSSVSTQQKYTAIATMAGLSDAEKLAAILSYDPSAEGSTYAEYAAAYDAGLSVEEYDEYRVTVSGISSDKDANGKTISGSKKAKVVAAIDAMPITDKQKDFLFLQDYTESGLSDTPWHSDKYAGQLPYAGNNFRGQSGGIRSKNTIRGKSGIR